MRLLNTSFVFLLLPVMTLNDVSLAFGDNFVSPSVIHHEGCPNCRVLPKRSEALPESGRMTTIATGTRQSQAEHRPLQSPSGISSADGQNPEVPAFAATLALTDEENALLNLTNAERNRGSLTGFIADPALMQMAREHARSMASLQQLSHTIEGRSFSIRLMDSGYRSAAAGENVAEGQRHATEAVRDWMNSPGHRANIMNGQFTHIGVAVSVSKSGRRYYAQVFAKPLASPNSFKTSSY